MEKTPIVIAGIGTDVGKTVVSAIVCEALKADYWKPIQAGDLSDSDTMKVEDLVSNPSSKFHTEAFRLNTPMSPHESARKDGLTIHLNELQIPETDRQLVIEMAGGLMVPVSSSELFIDFVQRRKLPVILVSSYYLGSINHTLLSLEILKSRGIEVLGIIFNGAKVQSTYDVIMNFTSVKCLLEIEQEETLTPNIISSYASRFQF